MEENYIKMQERLKKYNQEHLLKFYDSLNQEKKDELLNQISSINFEQLRNLYSNINNEIKNDTNNIVPISYTDKEKITEEDKEKYYLKGSEKIKDGKLAVVTMAGGQGTRLRA